MSKYKAYQVDESAMHNEFNDIDMSEQYPNVSLVGNRHLMGYKAPIYEEAERVINDINYRGLTAEDLTVVYAISASYAHEVMDLYERDGDGSVDLLTLILESLDEDGRRYEVTTLRGYGQSDWMRCVKPVSTDVRYLESIYFGLYNEYRIVVDEDEPTEDEYYTLVHQINFTDPKDELCNIIGCAPEELTVYDIDGYKRTPIYKVV